LPRLDFETFSAYFSAGAFLDIVNEFSIVGFRRVCAAPQARLTDHKVSHL